MPSPRFCLALLGCLIVAAPALAVPQAGDWVAPARLQKQIEQETNRYFAAKDSRAYDRAYAFAAPSMQSYLTADLFRETADRFNAEAGPVVARRVTRLSWYRDPIDAGEPGLYVAADFTAIFPNIELMCGYVMWRQLADGRFLIVREEQNFVDKPSAHKMAPEQRARLPEIFGCVGPVKAVR